MADNEAKAMELEAQADKKLKSATGFFGSMFGGSNKQDEAAELLTKAANTYKMAKKWAAAGNAFCKAADLHMKLESKHDSAVAYCDAANCFKKADPNEAVNCLSKAIEIYTNMGRFTIAAKHHITIAEIYESEMIDIAKAISHYEQAADYYKGEESMSSANKCLLKVAQYAATLEKYDKAIQIYEEVAGSAMDNQLLRYSARDHFFRAALCHLCVDSQNTLNAIQKYEEMFPVFADSREYKFLKKLISALEEQNLDLYTDTVREYDSISRLDQWYTTLLLRIKKGIEGESDLL